MKKIREDKNARESRVCFFIEYLFVMGLNLSELYNPNWWEEHSNLITNSP
jgi:hypothetical protein